MRIKLSENFYEDEFHCKCGCGEWCAHPNFIELLQLVRDDLGLPMYVLSGGRCKEHNDRPASEGGAGGHPKSLHVFDYEQHPGQLGCMAVDIATLDGGYRGQLFQFAWNKGFSVGWNAKRRFLHLDLRIRVGLPQMSFDY